MSVPTRSWASAVAAPMWGVATTLGWQARRQSTGGSWEWTSRAAPATRPLSRAARSAASSISSPRPAFTIRAPGLILERASLPIRWRVSLVRVVWSVKKSQAWSSSSKETSLTRIFSATAGATKGSKA